MPPEQNQTEQNNAQYSDFEPAKSEFRTRQQWCREKGGMGEPVFSSKAQEEYLRWICGYDEIFHSAGVDGVGCLLRWFRPTDFSLVPSLSLCMYLYIGQAFFDHQLFVGRLSIG